MTAVLLPATLLSRYLFFLARRPVSAANAHYRSRRVAALKSLGPMLDRVGGAEVERVTSALRALTPANLFRLGPELQSALKPFVGARMPRDLVVSPHPPPARFWSGVGRVAVVYGPAIGIGDEIITAAVPRALRTICPGASITVLTAYDGLWERLAPEERVEQYADLRELVDRMLGGAFEAIVFIDFEPAGLVTAMSFEPRVERYIELSLGTRALTVLDNGARTLHQLPAAAPYHDNFYFTLRHMLEWLGAHTEGESALPRTPSGEMVIVASPFTSKEEPSERLWRTILTSELAPGAQIVLDTGPNAATRSVAVALRDAVRAGGTIRCELAAGGRAASLGEMLDLVRGADAVLTADSYLAHAGPALGAMTLVVARDGLEAWRVPSPSSFYFRSSAEPASIAAAMQCLLRERAAPDRPESRRLRDAVAVVRDKLSAPLDDLLAAWQECLDAHNEVLASLPEWPAAYAALFDDQRYGRLMPRAPRRDAAGEAELRAHLAGRFAECENSNLWKLVAGRS
jgi:hypothetical protein